MKFLLTYQKENIETTYKLVYGHIVVACFNIVD